MIIVATQIHNSGIKYVTFLLFYFFVYGLPSKYDWSEATKSIQNY